MSTAHERFFELLPAVHRIRDAESGHALEALMGVLEREFACVERDVERLFEDWFVETCSPWVVPYIGDLLEATRLRAYDGDGASLRAYVANTIAYRRRKGTVAVLEQLARDVTAWPAHAVEFFHTLSVTQQLNHVRSWNAETPDLRTLSQHDVHVETGQGRFAHVGGPFDTTTHLLDVRSIERGEGKHNVPHIGIFVFRLEAQPLVGVVPREVAPGSGRFTLDPVGRDLQLFQRPRVEREISQLSTEINVPSALRRRALRDDLEALKSSSDHRSVYFPTGAAGEVVQPVLAVHEAGGPVEPRFICSCDLRDRVVGGSVEWARPGAIAGRTTVAVDPERGRLSFPKGAAVPASLRVDYAIGSPGDVGGGAYERDASVDSWIQRWRDAGNTLWQRGVHRGPLDGPSAGVVTSLRKAIQDWNAHVATHASAHGLIVIMDSASYAEALPAITIPGKARLAIVAADWPATSGEPGETPERRQGHLIPRGVRPHVLGNLVFSGSQHADGDRGTAVIDGLLLEGSVRVAPGELGELIVRHSTLGARADGLQLGLQIDGGARGRNSGLRVGAFGIVSGKLEVKVDLQGVRIERSILGEAATLSGTVVNAGGVDLELDDCTVFGKTKGRTLSASNTIFQGRVDVVRRQQGCVRFSYVPARSRLPRFFRCQPDLALREAREEGPLSPAEAQAIRDRVQPAFTSSRWGDAAFAQLASQGAVEVAAGAEDGSEMGVFRHLSQPHREVNLRQALGEYLRAGLRIGHFYVT